MVSGQQKAAVAFESLADNVPQDAIISANKLHFDTSGERLLIGWADESRTLHRHALGQLVEKTHVGIRPFDHWMRPAKTEKNPDGGEQWERELAAHVLEQTYQHRTGRHLLRSINGEVRGFMSDKYRRLDVLPILSAVVQEAREAGAVAINATTSDIQTSFKMVIPEIIEAYPGEFGAYGFEFVNSDYGARMVMIRIFWLRPACLNGAVLSRQLGQVHLGRAIPDEIELSVKTMELDTETMVSAARDVTKSILLPETVTNTIDLIKVQAGTEVSWQAVEKKLTSALSKGDLKLVKDYFEGEDVINLPPVRSNWRAAQALGFMAKTADGDRKIDLEELAGKLIAPPVQPKTKKQAE